MNKPKAKNSSKKIIQQAKEMFFKYGIHRVSVQEICKEAGVSKMTFYRAFKNKEAVAEKIIAEMFDRNIENYRAIMQQKIPFSDRIQQIIEWKQIASSEFSQEFIKDIFNLKESSLKTQLELYQQKMRSELINDFEAAQKKGWIRKDIKLGFILFMLNDMDRKLKDEQFLALYNHNIIDAGMELTKFFFNGIMPNKDPQNSKDNAANS